MLLGAAVLPPQEPNRFLDAIALINLLPTLTAQARTDRDTDIKGQAKDIGVTPATLTRFEAGSTPTKKTIVAVLTYLAK